MDHVEPNREFRTFESRYSKQVRLVGLDLGGAFTRVTVLDAVGELLEEGTLRSTEAGICQKFAAMPPTLISAQYDPCHAGLLKSLSAMGHQIVLSGPVSEAVSEAVVAPAVRLGGYRWDVECAPEQVLMRRPDGEVGFAFLVELEKESAWFFLGPLPAGTDLAARELAHFDKQRGVSSFDLAVKLHALWRLGGAQDAGEAGRVAAA